MPSIIKLPARSGTFSFTEDDIQETLAMLAEATEGQGVAVSDPLDGENKARDRAKKMAEAIKGDVAEGYRVRTHAIKTGEDSFTPAVSLVKATAKPEAPAETPAPAEGKGKGK